MNSCSYATSIFCQSTTADLTHGKKNFILLVCKNKCSKFWTVSYSVFIHHFQRILQCKLLESYTAIHFFVKVQLDPTQEKKNFTLWVYEDKVSKFGVFHKVHIFVISKESFRVNSWRVMLQVSFVKIYLVTLLRLKRLSFCRV